MAKFGSDSKGAYAIVEKGDTLSEICYEYFKDGTAKKYNAVAKLNGISNVNRIAIGQKIYLTGKASSTTTTSTNTSKIPTDRLYINGFGQLASSNTPTLWAAWTVPTAFTKNRDKFKYEWEYTRKGIGKSDINDVAGTGKWWTIERGETIEWECTCTIPDDAELIRFRVQAVAKELEKKISTTDSADKKWYEKLGSLLVSSSTSDQTRTVKYFPWTCKWTNFQGDGKYKPYSTSTSLPPKAPGAPTVKLVEPNNLKLTASIDNIDADDLNATHIEFQIVCDNKCKFGESVSQKIDKTYNYVSFTSTWLSPGHEYKVRCRAVRGALVSEWSSYSSSVTTAPSTPAGFTACEARSRSTDDKISVYLKWKAVASATSYKIEYATSPDYFDTDQTTPIDNITRTEYETYSLEPGHTYYFRFKAINGGGESDWSKVSSVALGEPPEAPTTWSSTTVASVGGPLTLYWVHNSEDGSSQTWAQLELEIYKANGIDSEGNINYELQWSDTEEVKNSTDFDEKDKTSAFDATAHLQAEIPSIYKEGVQLRWRVRTSGVTNELGDWSIVRMVDIYSEPTVTLELSDGSGTLVDTLDSVGSFPIHVSAITQPQTQAPIGFHLAIVSNDTYDTVDRFGNDKTVNAGEQIYSKYFDQDTDLETVLSAGDVDLENNVSYTITCVAAMNSGLTAETSMNFSVSWVDVSYVPNAALAYDPDRIVVNIQPYCETYTTTYYGVTYNSETDTYEATDSEVSVVEGNQLRRMYTSDDQLVYSEMDDDGNTVYYYMNIYGNRIDIDETQISKLEYVQTTSGEPVYSGSSELEIDEEGNVTGGETILYYGVDVGTRVEGVTLSVYRREFDGSFTELATGIDNTANTYITDPHPALDYARYRIVATTDSTGAVSYYDMPGYTIGEKSIIIQWDEEWSTFDTPDYAFSSQPPWSGSMLKLPYNVDVSDSYGMDVSLVQYAGRKRPVSYYGTQLGETSTWNTVIPKDDEETLYALRRLAIWTGDVYVREPSGTGYWANINVSFSQKHLDLTIPVTFTITRVEGGA